MLLNLFRRQENPAPSPLVKTIFAVYVIVVLLFYSLTLLMDRHKFGMAAHMVKKARIIVGTMFNPSK
jgi:hypothetical protein